MAYFTASCDEVEENTAFAKKLKLDYPILSDPGRKVAKAYGVVHGDDQPPKRWTFIIGRDGKIAYVDRQVKAADHATAVLAKLKELGIEKKAD